MLAKKTNTLRKMKKKLISILPVILFFIFITFSIYTIGSSSVLDADEYNYRYIFGELTKVNSFSDLQLSMHNFYNQWTGRIIVHGAIQLFLWLNTNLFYVLNSIVFVLFLIGILRFFKGKVSLFNTSILLFLILYCTQVFNQKYIWLSGSLNYLWPTCFMLYTLAFFYNGIVNNKKYNFFSTILFWIITFITGCSQENIAFVSGAFIIALVIFNIKKLWKTPLRTKIYWILSILIFGAGAFALIFAPGNFERLNNSSPDGLTLHFHTVFSNIWHIQNLIVIYIITLIVVFIKEWNTTSEIENSKIASNVDNVNQKDKKNKIKLYEKYPIIFTHIKYIILPCFVAILPMLIISEFYDRSMLPYETLILVGIMHNLNILLSNVRIKNKIRLASTIIFTFCVMLPLVNNIKFSIQYLKPFKNTVEEQVKTQKEANSDNLVVTKFSHFDKTPTINLTTTCFLDSLSNDVINQYAARYYEVASIYTVSEGCSLLEIQTSTPTTENFTVINNLDNTVLATRYFNSAHPISDMSYSILFEIPTAELENCTILLTDEAKNNITSIIYRNIGETKNLDINELNFGGYVNEEQ
jgi:hypothetical protein